jgi:hypothetical protein
VVVRTFGEPRQEAKLYNHVDLVQLLDIVDLEAGTAVAGGCCLIRRKRGGVGWGDIGRTPHSREELPSAWGPFYLPGAPSRPALRKVFVSARSSALRLPQVTRAAPLHPPTKLLPHA